MKRGWTVVVAVALVGMAGGALAAAPATGPAANFAKSCKSCHGPDATGVEKMAKTMKLDLALLNLVDAATLGKADADLEKVVTDGSTSKKMPSFKKKYKPEEIAALVAYIRTLKK